MFLPESYLIKPGLKKQIHELLQPERRPLLIMDYLTEGGSAVYAKNFAAKMLAEGRAVLRVVHNRQKKYYMATASWGGETVEFIIRSLRLLHSASFPRLFDVYVNEMVSWSVYGLDRWRTRRNGKGKTGYVGAALRKAVEIARHHQAGLYFTGHDFYAMCPSPHLLDIVDNFCGIPADVGQCAKCMPTRRQHRRLSVPRWRADWQYLFDNADTVTFFSKPVLEYMERVFSFAPGKVHITPPDPVIRYERPVHIPADGPMVVAVVGTIGFHKGAEMVIDMAALMQKQAPEARIVVIGRLISRREVPANITVTGPYQHEELPKLLEQHHCTAALFPSVVPETYSLVTQELMQLEMPLVCFPLGAPPERVSRWEKGLVAREISSQAALDALLELDGARFWGTGEKTL